jgi:hypothetical protein
MGKAVARKLNILEGISALSAVVKQQESACTLEEVNLNRN